MAENLKTRKRTIPQLNADHGNVGFLVAGLFVLVWALAVGWWKLGRVEARWTAEAAGREA